MAAGVFPAEVARLEEIHAFVVDQAESLQVPGNLLGHIELALEEAFINVATHAYNGEGGRVEIRCVMEEDDFFCITLLDQGAAFDPVAASMPEQGLDVEERPIGGLGIAFIKKVADRLTYARNGDTNELTMCFSLDGRA